MNDAERLEMQEQRGRIRDALLLKVTDSEFQGEVLERLGRLEAKIEMLVGGGQPGRMTLAEARIATLERSDAKRSVYDRLVNAAIATAISVAIALHDHFGMR
jgi:hypothetical protein